MIVDDLIDVDIKRLLEEEKRARMDNDGPKSALLCVEIVNYLNNNYITVKTLLREKKL